ncbi:MAG TPA: aminodeoxychorismate/anthranilate synthase component II [Bacteroidia bacterium]
MRKILVIDNYDSFTYNLVHLLKEVTVDTITVTRNDKIGANEVDQYDKILISPGPGIPSEAGISMEVIRRYAATKSVLGICLGHQAIAEVFGGKLVNTQKVYHGVATPIHILKKDSLFSDIPVSFNVGRYHSWLACKERFSPDLEITAEDSEGNIMALSHKHYDVKGLQFHPESILTPYGKQIMNNWINN